MAKLPLIGEFSRNTIVQGDCGELLNKLPSESIDLVITSPPYNMLISSGGGMRGSRKSMTSKRNISGGSWQPELGDGYEDYGDNMPWPEYRAWQGRILLKLWKILKPTGAIFYNHKPRVQYGKLVWAIDWIPKWLSIRQQIIWRRPGGFAHTENAFTNQHEHIWLLAKPDFRLKYKGAGSMGDVWEMSSAKNPHPAPFPISLPRKVLNASKISEGGIVLDPFMGSGTTAVACKEANIDYLGFELSEKYIKQANQRLYAVQIKLR